MNKVETRTACLHFGDDGILRAVYKEGSEESEEDAKENVAAAQSLVPEGKVPVLVDMSKMKRISRAARLYYSGNGPARYSAAQALIAASRVSRMIANFVLGIQKTAYPLRVFANEEAANSWLQQFRE